MSYTRRVMRSDNLNRVQSGCSSSNQPGISRNVLPPTNSRNVQQVHEVDPLADFAEEEFDLMEVLDSMEEGDTVQVQDFKEEEYEKEEYIVLDSSSSAEAEPQPKRVRFDSMPSTTQNETPQRATQGIKTAVIPPHVRSAWMPANSQSTNLPTSSPNNSTPKPSMVRVVPTERLRMAPTTTSNSVDIGAMSFGLQAKSFTTSTENSLTVKYTSFGTTADGSPVVRVNQSTVPPPPLKAYGTKQVHVKIVPLNTLNASQLKQLRTPLAGIASSVKGAQSSVATLQPGVGSPKISVIPITQNSSARQGYTLSSNPVKLTTPVGNNIMPCLDPLPQSPANPTLVQLKNSTVTITRIAPAIQVNEEKCTIDLAALENKDSILQEDPLATSSEPPGLVQQSSMIPLLQSLSSTIPGDPLATSSEQSDAAKLNTILPPLQPFSSVTAIDPLATSLEQPVLVQQGSTAHTLSRIIPIRKTIPSTNASGDPLAMSSGPSTVVKLMNTSLTVTRFENQSAVHGDPLVTNSELPVRPNTTSLAMTKHASTQPRNERPNDVNVGASTSFKPPPAQLQKPTVTVTKIVGKVPQGAPAKPAPLRTPIVTARLIPQKSTDNVQAARKNCDCRVAIAKRLKMLDDRTRQMESYMNDLIDLIEPENDFELQPVSSLEQLERLNYDMGSSTQYLQKVKNWLETRITSRESYWRMVDTMNLLFDKDFLLKCSWKISSKIALHNYTYIVELFKFVGTKGQCKVTIICVGNFLMNQLRRLKSKANNVLKNATNETDTTVAKDISNQEDSAVQDETTDQEATTAINEDITNQVDAFNQDDMTDVTNTIIEHEINQHEEEEYLDDEVLEDATYHDSSQIMSSDN